jgi:hypothetical protein
MSDEKIEWAKQIVGNSTAYSTDEVLRAIRYLIRNDVSEPLEFYINYSGLNKKEYVLEIIKQSRNLKSIDILKQVFQIPTLFDGQQIEEAIDVAIEKNRIDLLNNVISNPGLFSVTARDKVSKFLFEEEKATLRSLNEKFEGIPIIKLEEKKIREFTEPKKTVKKRTSIPHSVRMTVWKNNFGPSKAQGLCYVCGETISIRNFECGHIKSKENGGDNSIENLKPVCSDCNKSMGTMNLELFKEKFFSKKR